MTHTWRFFRSSGFDQVVIDSVEDLQGLASLDKKLWTALACPTKGLELDPRMLSYIDADNDGRIRVPELLAAVEWTLARLATPEVLLSGNSLVLAAINSEDAEGAKILAAGKQLLARLTKQDADFVSVKDTQDLSKMFPASQPNGDGLIPAALAVDPDVAQAINDIIATLGSEVDRSSEAAISAEKIKQFFSDLNTFAAWESRLTQEPELKPLGEQTATAYDALTAVEAKIDDYFVRVQ